MSAPRRCDLNALVASCVAPLALLLTLVLSLVLDTRIAYAASLTVTTTSDNLANDGECALREAIINANNNDQSGSTDCAAGSGSFDEISFAIPSAGVQTINVVGSALPDIVAPLSIDGWSQGAPGYTGPPLIELNGAGAGASANGLTFRAGGNLVRGLIVNRFGGNGLSFPDNAVDTFFTDVQGNYIGTNAAGAAAAPNGGAGIYVGPSAVTIQIGGTDPSERNVLSGNAGPGIRLETNILANRSTVLGNYIGTNAAGTAAVGNGQQGILVSASVGHIIGGTVAGTRNIISGNGTHGIEVRLASPVSFPPAIIEGNYIGTDVTGEVDLGNAQNGILLAQGAEGVSIGNELGTGGNLIAGNTANGILIDGASFNQIRGNTIGLSATDADLGNTQAGVAIQGSTVNTVIGGNSAAERNIISGNGTRGVYIAADGADGTIIRGNYIGTDATGLLDRGNDNAGVWVEQSDDTLIGGSETGQGNVISGNGSGVLIAANGTFNTSVLGNLIGLGADGTTDVGNGGDGVSLANAVTDTTLGGTLPGARNVIAGNGDDGVQLFGIGPNNVVLGNYIGTNQAGTAAVPNASDGIEVFDVGIASPTIIGGTADGARNLISGNSQYGIRIDQAANVLVQGNYVGTNAAGTGGVPNGIDGVFITNGSGNNVIGGTVAGARNVLGGNGDDGLELENAGTGNVVQGNYVGTNPLGTVAVPNLQTGIQVIDSPGTLIGGNTAGAGNLLSGNVDRGLIVTSDDVTVWGNRIGTDANDGALPNGTEGIFLAQSNNVIGGVEPGEANVIANNGEEGVLVVAAGSNNNRIRGNRIFNNGGLAIDLSGDLEGDGVLLNDAGDGDSGANGNQNFPVVAEAVPASGGTTIRALLFSAPNTTFEVDFYASTSCDASNHGEAATYLGSASTTTNAQGDAFFETSAPAVPLDRFVVATATGPQGTSEFSLCAPTGPANDAWTRALELAPTGASATTKTASAQQLIAAQGQARWYKVPIIPGAELQITLDNLPADYDLAVYRDITQTFNRLDDLDDLERLMAEFGDSDANPDDLAPNALAAETLVPEAFSSTAFEPTTFRRALFAPGKHSPGKHSPGKHSPGKHSPGKHSPGKHSPGIHDLLSYSPFAPNLNPDAYAGAVSRSLLAVSALDGTSAERLRLNTWNNTGFYYIRVQGDNGTFSLAERFELSVTRVSEVCNNVVPIAGAASPASANNGYRTIILTDPGRVEGTANQRTTLAARLNSFAARPEVGGVVVDVGAQPRVQNARTQALAQSACPYATNLWAEEIRAVVQRYRDAGNPLEYVVLVGSDDAIPFFRYPDQGGIGHESKYVPPVRDETLSRAHFPLGYVLAQDGYGSALAFGSLNGEFPLPELAVGRLVETAPEITGMLDAYLATTDGVVPTPNSALVSGYDFLADAASAISTELRLGLGTTNPVSFTTLIADPNKSPRDPSMWTAPQLQALLAQNNLQGSDGYDLMYLAGHFTHYNALAADHRTSVETEALDAAAVDWQHAIIYSNGCHSGYSLFNDHRVDGVTNALDWAQLAARKRATLIAGTGYQYGDTEFVEYGERLYLEFTRQLRTGTGPVALGKAMVAAKQRYLASIAKVEPLHEKTLHIATLYGLPMLQVNMPGARITTPSEPSEVTSTSPVAVGPGATLGLETANLTIDSTLTQQTTQLFDVNNPQTTYNAIHYSGPDGVVAYQGNPVLPLDSRNVTVAGKVLRGVGFRGGSYSDQLNVVPLTGNAATEIRGSFLSFPSNVFFPFEIYGVNYFDALTRPNGATQLMLTPAQFRATSVSGNTGTLRRYTSTQLRLFYSSNLALYGPNAPALADAPAIQDIQASTVGSSVVFSATVTGEPSAGIQQVWVTYTGESGPLAGAWQSLDLEQSANDSTLWTGTLPLNGAGSGAVRFIVQAVNGVGLVGLSDNNGAYYQVDFDATAATNEPAPDQEPTSLNLVTLASTSGSYGGQVTLRARLTSGGTGLAGQPIVFNLGAQTGQAITNGAGEASFVMDLLSLPGSYPVGASFAGEASFAPATASNASFTIMRRPTSLVLTPDPATALVGGDTGLVATLRDADDEPLSYETIFFTMSGGGSSYRLLTRTDFAGQVLLGAVPLPAGSYSVQAQFGGTISVPGATLDLDNPRYAAASDSAALTIVAPADTIPPDTTITGQPTNPTTSATATFSFTGTDNLGPDGLSFECHLSPATSFAACSSEQTYNGLATGSYTFTVRAKDAAGNVDGTPASYTWRVQVAQPAKVSPVLECVIDRGANSNPRYIARFGYNNPNSFNVSLPVGNDNRFTPTPQNRGQTTTFLPARQRFTFDVAFHSGTLVWTLNGKTSTASPNSTKCSPPTGSGPTASDSGATNVTSTAATLNALVRAGGLQTTVTFQWGMQTGVLTNAVTALPSGFSGTTDISVQGPLSGLRPNTTYYYRIVAVNARGVVVSIQQSFKTQP